jgi:hypothetical protein
MFSEFAAKVGFIREREDDDGTISFKVKIPVIRACEAVRRQKGQMFKTLSGCFCNNF